MPLFNFGKKILNLSTLRENRTKTNHRSKNWDLMGIEGNLPHVRRKMSMSFCAVESCGFKATKGSHHPRSGVSSSSSCCWIHPFPEKDPYLVSIWEKFCLGGSRKELGKQKLKFGGICSKHFKDEDKIGSGKRYAADKSRCKASFGSSFLLLAKKNSTVFPSFPFPLFLPHFQSIQSTKESDNSSDPNTFFFCKSSFIGRSAEISY